MRKIFLNILFVIISFFSFSKQIDESLANRVATNFYNSISLEKSSKSLQLSYKSEKNNLDAKRSNELKNVHYYVFTDSIYGFVIVSGNDVTYPILGYSVESGFDYDLLPLNVKKWLDNYETQIRDAFYNDFQQTHDIEIKWNELLNQTKNQIKRGGVNALLKTKWNQAPYFNDLCPYDNYSKSRTVSGCPATAMAQIMKYWNFPLYGKGSHFYNENNYGTLGADFSSSKYDWNNMPDIVNSKNLAVAKLIYDCGVSVETDYGVDGSGSYVIIDKNANYDETQTVEYALKTYFGYSPSLKGLKRENYSDESWIKILLDELNSSRPIQYVGYGQGGHTFVCDGYDINGSNIYFHMNWGWGGFCNGNYLLNSLTPGTGGTGAGAGSYNYGQQALIGIKPNSDEISTNLEIYQSVTTENSDLNYGEAFSVTTDVINKGKSTFYGDLCAAIFNKDGIFIDSVEVKHNISLPPSYHFSNGLTFSSSANYKMVPGEYLVRIFFKTENDLWSGINSNELFTNDYTTITVKYVNDFHLYAPLILTPNSNIYSNEKFVVWANVINESNTDFEGSLDISLYDLQGNLVETVETKENLSLKTNNYYTNGLAFVNNKLNVPPGTYILAVMHRWGNTDWQLTGGTSNYLNPIQIIVQDPPLQPDKYENNNEYTNSYNFNGSDGLIKTTASNIHIDSDVDFYKFSFTNNKENSVYIKLQDKYFSEYEDDYSIDAIFSYSFDGVNWSSSFDESLSDSIRFYGPKDLYVWVSPYFQGLTGTYDLVVNINNSKNSNVSNLMDNKIKIYPNPANDFIVIDNIEQNECDFIITDLKGKILLQEKRSLTTSKNKILIDDFPSGIYFITVQDSYGQSFHSKFTKL